MNDLTGIYTVDLVVDLQLYKFLEHWWITISISLVQWTPFMDSISRLLVRRVSHNELKHSF